MNKKYWAAAIFCMAAMYGCDDETGSTTTTSNNTSGCVPSMCASGECLPSGECKPITDPGPGPDPCDNGQCPVDITYLNKGDTCTIGSQTAMCKSPLICHNSVCTDQDDANLGKHCESSDDCADQDPFTTCMDNNHCGYYAEVGQKCRGITGGTIACTDGAVYQGSCALTLNEGDACDTSDTWRTCNAEDNNFCIAGFCQKYTAELERGATCNDSYRFCADGLECLDGICTQIAGEEEACNPSEHIICPPASTIKCLGGQCKRTAGTCASSSECTTSDTYCCTDESKCAEAFGQCIPYEGDVVKDETCRFKTKPGIFEAQIQCRWQATDGVEPTSNSVEMPPLVGHFGNKAGLPTVVAFYSYATGNQSRTPSSSHKSVIRFINPETCETLESIAVELAGRWFDYPAAVDLDDDGMLELLVVLSGGNLAAYKWDPATNKHKQHWKAAITSGDTIESFDVDMDGKPEIITGANVVGRDGTIIYNGNGGSYGRTFALGYMRDSQNNPFAFQTRSDGLFKFDVSAKSWVKLAAFDGTSSHDNNWTGSGAHTAYADFGTPGSEAKDFNFKQLDGIPEFIIAGSGLFKVYSVIQTSNPNEYTVQNILTIPLLKADDGTAAKGGPITVGDFDNDGLPEIGLASTGYFGVYDPLCEGYKENECADQYVLWERWSQDASSGTTGSSLFDFDGDGQAEAVYADECFTRVYDGKTGTVLFSSARSSETSIEGPVVADIDNDGSSEILMGSDKAYSCYNDGGSKAYAAIDPIHEGIRCENDGDCPTNKCKIDIGLCICGGDDNPDDDDDECNTQYLDGKLVKQYKCTYPIHKDVGFMKKTSGTTRTLAQKRGTRPDGYDTATGYKVCRAYRNAQDTTSPGRSDLMILKDRLDRWVSSRNMWNQHAYNIINVEDNGSVPSVNKWFDNWMAKLSGKTITGTSNPRPKYNNYRLNSQGEYGAGMAPDITGKFKAGSICGQTADGKYVISAKLCNRGTKPAGKDLPATFFYYDEDKADHRGTLICTSYTNKVFVDGECADVGCEITEDQLKDLEGKKVLMVSNLNEHGQASTVECNDKNNTDVIEIDTCKASIVITN